jgi:peptide methionine sulfoxide reductase MsrA
MNTLIKVDQDLIRELKERGQVYEAYQLHQAYLKNKKQNKEQLRKEIKKQEAKVQKCKKSN